MSALCSVCCGPVDDGHGNLWVPSRVAVALVDHSKCEEPWHTNHAEVCSFASMLIAHAQFQGESIDDSLGLLLYYFEKPWKWSTEHEAWRKAGRPAEGWVLATEAANKEEEEGDR